MEVRSPSNSRRSRVRQSATDPPLSPPSRLFKLAEEPNERQRKSYYGETRLMSPSPLTIIPISAQSVHPSVQGVVHVKLVSETGADEDDSMLQGVKTVALNQEHRADFFLKLVKTSKKKLRLKFSVHCQSLGGQTYQETILSLPFAVITTKKNKIYQPEVVNMHLKYGLADRENEIWIKGKNFSARNTMQVMFGDQPANILETEDNLIICTSPIMPVAPGCERQVEVRVANIDPKEGRLEAEQILIFTYCGQPMLTSTTPIATPLSLSLSSSLTSSGPQPMTLAFKEEIPGFNWNTEANSFFNQYRL